MNALKITDTVYRYIDGESLEIEDQFNPPRDVYSSKGDNASLCKSRVDRAMGSILPCKEANFGKNESANLLLLYNSDLIPRLLHNAESYSNHGLLRDWNSGTQVISQSK